jgi:hypothetical protein
MKTIRRRDVLTGLGVASLTAVTSFKAIAAGDVVTPEEFKRRMAEHDKQARANFPLKLIETTGKNALRTWEELKAAGQGSPVVLGGDVELGRVASPFGPPPPYLPGLSEPPPLPERPTVEEIVRKADGLKFPDDLVQQRKAELDEGRKFLEERLKANPNTPLPTIIVNENGASRTLTREEVIASMKDQPQEPPSGEWPSRPPEAPSISDLYRDIPDEKIYIAVAPTEDWTTLPAHLHWGGWNACPAPEYHVAALRSWRDRYGAELVGLSGDVMNLRVARKPKTREEALALAREHHVYCNDTIDQGVGTLSALAAAVMVNDWWFFWWD